MRESSGAGRRKERQRKEEELEESMWRKVRETYKGEGVPNENRVKTMISLFPCHIGN